MWPIKVSQSFFVIFISQKALTFSHKDNLEKALKMFDGKKFNQCSEDYRKNLEKRINEAFLGDQVQI